MTFLNPFLLIGLAAAAIPLIIHLFNFRRPRRVDFSSLAFLHELKKSTMQRVKIKQWLLLVLRTLAIAFLVLSFARPTLTGSLINSIGGSGKSSSAIVFDNSLSMQLRDGSGSYLEQARTIAATLINEMQPGDELFLVPTVGDVSSVASPAYVNQSSARKAILELDTQDGQMALSESVSRAQDLLRSAANPNTETYIFSDLQTSTFIDSVARIQAYSSNTHLIPIGQRNQQNIAISDVQVQSRILAVGEVVRMEATLVNYGDRAADDVVLSLYLEGDRVARATTDIVAGEATTVPISVTPRETGWLSGHLEIEDEDFRNDDVRRFTLFIPEERNILVVGGQAATTAFIELALSEEVTERRVRFNVEKIDEIALVQASLGVYDTVVLIGITDLSSGERSSLRQYVSEGGGLLIFPGDNLSLSDFNELLSSMGGGSIQAIAASSITGASVAGFEQFDYEHALFEGMFESTPSGEIPTLEQPDIYKYARYQPGEGSESTLIQMSGNESFLQEIRHESGSALLFAVAPEEGWSDLPLRGLFVPLLYRSIYYLSAGGSVTGEEFSAGNAAQLRLTGVPSSAEISINSAAGESYIPELRQSPGAVLAIIEPGFLEAGHYDVRVNAVVVRKFVVHPVEAESDLETHNVDGARQILESLLGQPVRILNLSGTSQEQVRAQISSIRTGIELWNVFLGLALVMLLAEMVVEKKWRPEAA